MVGKVGVAATIAAFTGVHLIGTVDGQESGRSPKGARRRGPLMLTLRQRR